MTDSAPSLLDKPGAAERLCISQRGLERLVASGKIGYVEIGGRIMFRPDHLAAFIDAHTVDPNDDERQAG